MKRAGNSERPGGGEVGFCYPRRADLDARVVNGLCSGSCVSSCEGRARSRLLGQVRALHPTGLATRHRGVSRSSRSGQRNRRPRWLWNSGKLRLERRRECGAACGSRPVAVPNRFANPSLVRAAAPPHSSRPLGGSGTIGALRQSIRPPRSRLRSVAVRRNGPPVRGIRCNVFPWTRSTIPMACPAGRLWLPVAALCPLLDYRSRLGDGSSLPLPGRGHASWQSWRSRGPREKLRPDAVQWSR